MAGRILLMLAVATIFMQDMVVTQYPGSYFKPPVIKGKGYFVQTSYVYDSSKHDHQSKGKKTAVVTRSIFPSAPKKYGYGGYPEYGGVRIYGYPKGHSEVYRFGPYYPRYQHGYGRGYGGYRGYGGHGGYGKYKY